MGFEIISKDKCRSIFSSLMEATVFIMIQMFFPTNVASFESWGIIIRLFPSFGQDRRV